MHQLNLLTTIAFGLSAAWVFGLIAAKLRLSPIVGYLVAGIAIGPHTPGFVGDTKLAGELAEIGVILLMFGVGLHFHLKDLLSVRAIAIPGALGQSLMATLCSLGLALAAGWTWQNGLVLGIATSVASTVVLLRVLMDRGLVDTPQGHVAVGWLIVEDLITVLVLVLLPSMAAKGDHWTQVLATAGIALLKLAALGGIFAVAGIRLVPMLMIRVAAFRSRELFTLTVLVFSISVATVSYLVFGASMALGAFLAGMVVGQTKVSEQAAADALPLRDAFAVLFFVSVGMLFDFRTVLNAPWLTLGVFVVILVVKPVVALVIVFARGYSLATALTVAGGLAQIGEFSFILAESGKGLGLLSQTGADVLVAAAIGSISLNPWIFNRFQALEPRLARIPALQRWLAGAQERRGSEFNLQQAAAEESRQKRKPYQAIVIGQGPVGRHVAGALKAAGLRFVVVETNIETVLELHEEGTRALYGDGSHPEILTAAGVEKALYLVVTLPTTEAVLATVNTARRLNPGLRIFARARYVDEGDLYAQAGVEEVRFEEAEVADALTRALLNEIQARPPL
ncbi:MAG: cation:proton antiporter [Chthoniobacteraceae bacterium]